MRNRYYTVGAPIEDLQGNFIIGVSPKVYTQEELEQLSFYKLVTIGLFASCDQAREYAYGLRENAGAYASSEDIKANVRRSRVYPVFTLELAPDIKLGELCSVPFKYAEYIAVNKHQTNRVEKNITLNCYMVQSSSIENTNIIRAEFYHSKMAPVEFAHESNQQRCVIL